MLIDGAAPAKELALTLPEDLSLVDVVVMRDRENPGHPVLSTLLT